MTLALKDPIRTIIGLKEAKRGHSLKEFYIPTLVEQQKLPWLNTRIVKEENVLEPVLCKDGDQTTFEVTKIDDNTYRCKLMTKGSFLSNVQLEAKRSNFQGISFHDSDSSALDQEDDPEETMIISGECSAKIQEKIYETNLRQLPLSLKFATTFGLFTAFVTNIHSPLPPASADDRENESIATLIEKSLLRCISIHSMAKRNKTNELSGKLDDLARALGFGDSFFSHVTKGKSHLSAKIPLHSLLQMS